MKSFQLIRLTVFALAIVFNFVASATPISGKVADAGSGEAIIGATIYDARSHVGVTTDAEGNFRIDVARFPSELKISYVGYEQKTIRVKGDDKDRYVVFRKRRDRGRRSERDDHSEAQRRRRHICRIGRRILQSNVSC